MSNFSNIGFSVANEDEYRSLIDQVYSAGDVHQAKEGYYVAYTDPSGAEMWLQLDDEHALIGVNPHFKGKSRRRASVTSIIEGVHSALNLSMYAWAAPSEPGNPESGFYPFVFDLPDGKTWNIPEFPQEVIVQLSAFAQNLDFYNDVKDFNESQEGKIKFAAEAFIPSGLFGQKGETNPAPQAYGLFAGTVLEWEHFTNQLTGQSFYWMLVDTLGGTVDVVADSSFLNTLPAVNGVIFGEFWLSGQLLVDP